MTALVAGPNWSPPGLQVAAGRYPLSVEPHMMRMVALLVPGVTTVTLNARYYALHALAALEATDRGLDVDAALRLLRRMEVVMGGVSVLHDHEGLPRAHGADAIGPALRAAGVLDVAALSEPGRGHYAEAHSGYWGPYVGSEVVLGAISPGRIPTPGPRCDAAAIRRGLGDLVELAAADVVGADTLRSAPHLCLCAGTTEPDGRWLRELLCDPPPDPSGPLAKPDRTRRATCRLLAATVAAGDAFDFTDNFVSRVGFGRFCDEDPVAAGLDEAEVWRGVVLRRYSVGAWRRLWAWLVDQVVGLVAVEELADAFADSLPGVQVGRFLEELPATMADERPVAAEETVRAQAAGRPEAELAVLALGGRRAGELSGTAGEAFRGRPVELSPQWVARRFEAAQGQTVRDLGRDLVVELVQRGRRVAMAKMRRRADGTIWLPTRLHDKGGLLYRTSGEGSGDVALRIAQLGRILVGVGVFGLDGEQWRLSEAGRDALGV